MVSHSMIFIFLTSFRVQALRPIKLLFSNFYSKDRKSLVVFIVLKAVSVFLWLWNVFQKILSTSADNFFHLKNDATFVFCQCYVYKIFLRWSTRYPFFIPITILLDLWIVNTFLYLFPRHTSPRLLVTNLFLFMWKFARVTSHINYSGDAHKWELFCLMQLHKFVIIKLRIGHISTFHILTNFLMLYKNVIVLTKNLHMTEDTRIIWTRI